jgi:beta-lactamase class A
VLDIRTGQSWYLNPNVQEDSASIVKVDIMAALLARSSASNDPLSADDQDLLTSMIELSDNASATTLWNAVGGAPALKAFDQDVGMTQTTPSTCLVCAGFAWPGWGLTKTTAKDQLTLLGLLVFPNTVVGSTERTDALNLMENVTSSERWGVTAGVPTGVTVALKNGWVPLPDSLWQVDSIGWIDGDGRDYLLAVLSDGNPSEDYGIATDSDVASSVWSALAPASSPPNS